MEYLPHCLTLDHGHAEINAQISEATSLLTGTIVPDFVKEDLWSTLLEARRKALSISSIPVTSLLHSKGINLRYLGAIVSWIVVSKKAQVLAGNEEGGDSLIADGVRLLLCEMTSRCLKQQLRKKLRRRMEVCLATNNSKWVCHSSNRLS